MRVFRFRDRYSGRRIEMYVMENHTTAYVWKFPYGQVVFKLFMIPSKFLWSRKLNELCLESVASLLEQQIDLINRSSTA